MDAKIDQLDVLSRQAGRDIAHMIQALDNAIKHNQQVFHEINRLRVTRGEDHV